jgi:hypothetical protein
MKKNIYKIILSIICLFQFATAFGADLRTLQVQQGGTGRSTFPLGSLLVGNLTGGINSTTSPTVGYITATSTTATSTFVGGATFATGGGNVGIGTTTPSRLFTVSGSGIVIQRIESVSNNIATLELSRLSSGANSTSYRVTNNGGSFQVDRSTDGFSNVTNDIAIFSDSVGFGTSTPWGKLSVTNTTVNPSFIVEDTASPDTSPFIIDANGSVAIGSSTATNLFNVVGGVYQHYISGTPTTLGGADLAASAQAIYSNDQFTFMTNSVVAGTCSAADATGCEVRIYNTADKSNPMFVGGIDLGVTGGDIFAVDDRLYFVTNTDSSSSCSSSVATGCEFRIYNIANPSSPQFIGGFDLTDSAFSLKVFGKTVFITKTGNGGTCSITVATGCELLALDISQLASPTFLGGFSVGGTTNKIAINGSYAYVVANTGATNEVQIFDITNPKSIFPRIATLDFDVSAIAVFVRGNYLFVGTVSASAGTGCSGTDFSNCEVRVYDISNPTAPSAVSGAGIDVGAQVNTIRASGNYLYVGNTSIAGTCSGSTLTGCELKIYDISNIGSPSPVGGIDYTVAVNGLFMSGKYGYVALNSVGGNDWRIFDTPGIVAPAAQFGNVSITRLGVTNSMYIGNDLYVDDTATFGSGFASYGEALIQSMSTSTVSALSIVNGSSTPLMYVLSNGNVGVGSSSPEGRLSVQGDSAGSATKGTCFRSKDVGAATYTYWWYKAGVQTVQTASCSGTGTTTVTFD